MAKENKEEVKIGIKSIKDVSLKPKLKIFQSIKNICNFLSVFL